MHLGAFLDIPNPMPKQRPQRCNARRRRSDAALYRGDREGRLMSLRGLCLRLRKMKEREERSRALFEAAEPKLRLIGLIKKRLR